MLFLLLSISCKRHVDEDVIRFGVDVTSPPYSFIENGELKGFEIDLDRELGKELNKKVEFKILQLSSLLVALYNKQIDAISNVSPIYEREKNADFSRSYYYDYIAMVFRKNNVLDLKDLKNKKVGCVYDTNIEVFIKKIFMT